MGASIEPAFFFGFPFPFAADDVVGCGFSVCAAVGREKHSIKIEQAMLATIVFFVIFLVKFFAITDVYYLDKKRQFFQLPQK